MRWRRLFEFYNRKEIPKFGYRTKHSYSFLKFIFVVNLEQKKILAVVKLFRTYQSSVKCTLKFIISFETFQSDFIFTVYAAYYMHCNLCYIFRFITKPMFNVEIHYFMLGTKLEQKHIQLKTHKSL